MPRGRSQVKEDEIAQIKVEATRVNKVRESTLNKMKNLEKQKVDTERVRDDLRTEIGSLEREIDTMRKGLETERKKHEELMRERDILNKLKTQAENATQRQVDLVKINENTKRNLEQEIQGYKVRGSSGIPCMTSTGCEGLQQKGLPVTLRMLPVYGKGNSEDPLKSGPPPVRCHWLGSGVRLWRPLAHVSLELTPAFFCRLLESDRWRPRSNRS